ncbi:hypothetical protein DV711_01690 [Motiliproteus coralliicola]|uniref:Uncharacterized protein n=1 Tax=Motiliproteus coralliicola TaxID=2283196 RepID=A0A369WQG0_9GAMM|nr:hypothetical protein [Motiliproteus coralliicola]RDE24328.1 hypothetical protein DV711_01690 [Motiliproteus coralliicola]
MSLSSQLLPAGAARTGLSQESIGLLHRRGLSEEQVDQFEALLMSATEKLSADQTAKQVLAGLSAADMQLLQRATSLADPIHIESLSDEGAINLLAQPDKTGMVDLNNDGVVEIGKAKTLAYPPLNAPVGVHEAWERATANLSEADVMMLQFHMATANGIELGTHLPKPSGLSPEQEWSTAGWQALLEKMRSALDFSVSMDGWTRTNRIQQDFYNRFEHELASMSPQESNSRPA